MKVVAINAKNPHQLIEIFWLVENPASSGSTICEAWRGQHELDCLVRGGYRIISVFLL